MAVQISSKLMFCHAAVTKPLVRDLVVVEVSSHPVYGSCSITQVFSRPKVSRSRRFHRNHFFSACEEILCNEQSHSELSADRLSELSELEQKHCPSLSPNKSGKHVVALHRARTFFPCSSARQLLSRAAATLSQRHAKSERVSEAQSARE